MGELIISKRLKAICSFVDQGARLIDVGTDHAYVPINLLLNGVVDRAWASDINPGPLHSANENAYSRGVSDRLTLYLSDGLDGCECFDNRYDHIVIAGMGGEMIFDIVERCEYIKSFPPKLILQPMTMQPFLRKRLCECGYVIYDETVIFDEGKYYTLMICRYLGKTRDLSSFEIAFGKGIVERVLSGDLTSKDYLIYQRKLLLEIVQGKSKGNIDHACESQLIEEIDRILS